MKKFLLKSVLLTLLVVCILLGSSAVYKHSYSYRNLNLIDHTDQYETMPEDVEIAVFGASHGVRGFACEPEGYSFFNFAMNGQTPQYDLMLMRQFGSHIQPGALVILTVSYMSPFWEETDFDEKQPRYYRILSPENIVDVDPFRYVLQKYFPLLADNLSNIVSSILHKQQALDDVVDRVVDMSTLDRLRNTVIRDHWGPISACFPDTEPVMMDAYRQMLTMCRDNGWQAVLVTTPYLEEYNDCFPEEFFPAFYEAVDSLCQEFDVPYLDYSHSEDYYGRYDLFFDLHHLNNDGAAVFGQQFFADVQAAGIWE